MSYEDRDASRPVGSRTFQLGRGTKFALAGVGMLSAVYSAAGIYSVKEGQSALELQGGRIVDTVGPGWQHVWPVVQGVRKYDTGVLYEIAMDNMEVYYSPDQKAPVSESGVRTSAEIAGQNAQQYTHHDAVVRGTAKTEQLTFLHQKFGSQEAIQKYVSDRATEAYKAVVRKIDPLKIGGERELIGPKVMDLLQKTIDRELGVDGAIDIHSVVFKDFRFETGVKGAFEKANEERANIQAEQYRYEQESIKVDTATKQGEAQGAKILAEAKKKAEALEVEGKAIRENPEVLKIRQIEAWEKGGSKVPQTLIVGGGGVDSSTPFSFIIPAPPAVPAP